MKQKKLLQRAKARTQEKNKFPHFRGLLGSILLLLIIVSIPTKTTAEVVVFLDPVMYGENEQLTVAIIGVQKYEEKKRSIPLLFVHGHNFDKNENYKKTWQESQWLPSFKAALELNSYLDIEPYYIHFDNNKQHQSIVTDAQEIGQALELIIKRHHNLDYTIGMEVPTDKRVAIIAHSKGTISTRYYLNDLMPENSESFPVSEFIALSPINHGTNFTKKYIEDNEDSLALKQSNNGYDEECMPFDPKSDPETDSDLECNPDSENCNFINKLNGHALGELDSGGTRLAEHKEEAPHSRRCDQSIDDGILYATLYAKDNGDSAGGSTLKEGAQNCHGRIILGRNLARDAINIEIPSTSDAPDIPGIGPLTIHTNTPHCPEVIGRALYMVVHHQVPPCSLTFGIKKENDTPIIPPTIQEPAQMDAGVILLLDTSGSMSWAYDGNPEVDNDHKRLTLAKRAVEPFMHILHEYMPCKANFGVCIFPEQPQNGCQGQFIYNMANIECDSKYDALNTIWKRESGGNTPLLAGIDEAIQMFTNAISMFTNEAKKAIILLSDGYHNCPGRVNINDKEVNDIINRLNGNASGIDVYTIGFGRPTDTDPSLLGELASRTGGEFKDVTASPGFNPNDWKPETALDETYVNILKNTLGLQAAKDPMGVIKKGDTITDEVKINKRDGKICFFLSWATPQQGRLELALKASDEIDVPTAGIGVGVHQGDTYRIITVDKSFLEQPGKVGAKPWTIEIKPTGLGTDVSENYQYSVIMQSDLEMKTSFNKTSYRTGDIITITAKITAAGQRVKGLKNVKVTVTRPGDGIGNWYAANKITTRQLDSIPDKIGDENISPAHRKAIYLTDKLEILLPQRKGPETFPMNDDGKNGDAKANDGIYTRRYQGAIKEGTYSFYVQAATNHGSSNPFEREEMVQKYITVSAADQYSNLAVSLKDTFSGDLGLTYFYHVKVAPRDRFGNYLGPGRGVTANIFYKKRTYQAFTLDDNLDGTYSGAINISQSLINEGAKLAINLDGKSFTTVNKFPTHWWSIGANRNKTFPIGSFKNNYDGAFGFGFNVDYHVSHQFSVGGLVGFNRFKSTISPTDDHWWNISANVKYVPKKIRILNFLFWPYINAGPGIYIPKSGNWNTGFNFGFGLGLGFQVIPKWTMELGADYHHLIFTGDKDITFLVAHAGLIFRLL